MKILQLITDNLTAPRAFNITAQDAGTRIDLYDVIDDYYGVSAQAFVTALNNVKDGDIALHINSPGGDVFAARTMVAAIAAHPSKITAYVDGLAASAASYVALACDSVVMQSGAMMMVHRASAIVWGNSEDMVNMADLLDKIDGTIVDDYVRKTGKSKDEMLALMTAETWMTAEEAKEHGFVDSIVKNEKGKAKNIWKLDAFANAPKELLEPESTEPAPEAVSSMSTTNANKLKLIQVL